MQEFYETLQVLLMTKQTVSLNVTKNCSNCCLLDFLRSTGGKYTYKLSQAFAELVKFSVRDIDHDIE